MQMQVGCLDGKTYTSDYSDDAEMMAEINKVGGYIGSGVWSHRRVSTVEEAVDLMRELMKEVLSSDEAKLSMQVNGQTRNFNVANVTWAQIYLDKAPDNG